MADPRACRDPFPFTRHLSLAELDELADLTCKRVLYTLSPTLGRRYGDLASRKIRTQDEREQVPEGAA